MQAIVDAITQQSLPARVSAVIANRSDASGLEWACERGLETHTVAHTDFASREDFDLALGDAIETYKPHYVLLAGFMRVLTPGFVQRFNGRLINIHPSLLPAFPGLHTHKQALTAGVQWHGCTLHFVTPVLDHGPIIAQGLVAVHAADNPDTLAARVLRVEHRLYAELVGWLSHGRVSLDDAARVHIQGVDTRSFLLTSHGVESIEFTYDHS